MTKGAPADQRPALADDPERVRAIDPVRSCIVQAPAGSGKTTLLAERFVALLAGVEQPEQILAITFTKKAAAEMRQRVREELADTNSTLGVAAMARSLEKSWGLELYPSRLRIQTIDSFAMSLVKQLPITSQLQQRDICDHPDEYYQRSVARVLQRIAEPGAEDNTTSLLREFGGNTQQVQNLLVTMLRRREQWLFSLADQLSNFDPERLVDAISEGVTALQNEALASLLNNMSLPTRRRLEVFARYASDCLGEKTAFSDLTEFEQWRFIAQNLVLLAAATLEKPQVKSRLTKNNGFPPTKENTHKQDLTELLKEFASDTAHADILQALTAIRDIPQMDAATRDRDRLAMIGTTLFNCVYELNKLFDERGEVDYNQITIAAITALGSNDAPTELALSLDYRISHLLIDEFQDTSRSQHMLFERLITEWTPDDNNTFFAVGDPMQSIYRFRNAEVSLFLEVCNTGIANLQLEHLQLTTNFRSNDTMIGWFNQVFNRVLGDLDDTNLGRISYAPATSPRGDLATLPKTTLFAPMQLSESVAEQHSQLIAHIQELAAEQDTALTDIAILVRNRTPVGPLVRALEAAGIEWQGTDLHALAQTAIVSDLVALANTLFAPTDRISALAVLRSPLVGLNLNDLYAVAQYMGDQAAPQSTSLINLLQGDPEQELTAPLPGMTEQGYASLTRLIQAAQPPISKRLQLAPRELIETIWLQLGGPAAYPPSQLKHAERLLDTIELAHPVHFSPPRLLQDIQKLYAEDDGTGVQILTVHKSKGLQYKHVLLPHLEAGTRSDEAALMLQRASTAGTLLACKAPDRIKDFDKNNKTVYHWLKLEDSQRARNETRRVLYVAATRAEQTLKLFATVPADKKSATSGSLLSCLSDVYGELWQERDIEAAASVTTAARTETEDDSENAEQSIVTIQALPATLPLPDLPAPAVTLPERSRNIAGRRETDEPDLLFALERRAAILRGNLTHQALCTLSQNLSDTTSPTDQGGSEGAVNQLIANERHLWEQQALLLGLSPEDTQQLADSVVKQLQQTASSGLGRWCALEPQTDAQAEIGLTLWENAGPLALVIDRMFVFQRPGHQAERWIIDYKTATPEVALEASAKLNSSAWLQQEISRYATQLARYARAVRAMHPDVPIRTALYFTATNQLWETGLTAPTDSPLQTAAQATPEDSIQLENDTIAQCLTLTDLTSLDAEA